MNVYTIKEYRDKFHAGKCTNTVLRMIEKGAIPNNHYVKKKAKCFLVMVTDSNEALHIYFDASVEYNCRKQEYKDYEMAAEIVVKYSLSATMFFKMHGL